jgi:hypothetical protein
MNPVTGKPLYYVFSILILAALACAVPQTNAALTPTSPTNPSANPSVSIPPGLQGTPANPTTSTPRPTPPPKVAEHRIATHTIYGIAQFIDHSNSQAFIPRGVNYFVLIPVQDHYEDRLFAPGVYDHKRTQADFAALAAAGYNTVRIIVDGCTTGNTCIGVQDGQGLNPAYLDNIADLMGVAKESGLFLIFSSQDLPVLGGYNALANQGASATFAAGRNAEFLTQEGIQAAQQYWSDLLGGLASRSAPFDAILGWELMDEAYYINDLPPFSLKTEKVTPANGKTYYLFDPVQKQTMAEDGMRYYIDQLRRRILIYDPTALVTMGFFAPNTPNPWREGDNRYVVTSSLLSSSSLDFFDLHANPDDGLSLPELAENFGLDEHVSIPVVMGSVGASTWTYPDVSEAAITIQDWIAASCDQGFSGWEYYGYYPSPAGLTSATWGFTDSQNYLLKALSPATQPDACTTSPLPGRNLALNKPVQVTEALPDQTAQMAVDGDFNTQWSSGAFPPQWIEIDLGAPYSIGEIKLTVGMWPSGHTVHELWVGSSRDNMQKIYTFSGDEFDYDVLDYLPSTPLANIRYVRVVTTESPSWVSWREIEVLAPFPATPTPTPEPSLTATP